MKNQAHPVLPRSGANRRQFICATGIAAAGAWAGLAAPGGSEKTLVGSNIFAWGQYAKRDNKPLNVDDVIAALSDAGYDFLEATLDLINPAANAELAAKLKAKRMQPVSLYTGQALHEADKYQANLDKVLQVAEVCAKAGFVGITCNPQPIKREKTDAELATQAKALNEFGRGLKKLGMSLGLHNHLPEMASNARELHYTLRHTDPELVSFCYDVHWVFRGGLTPPPVLKEYGERIVSWHLRQSRGGTWWEDLDSGDVDYAAVAQHAREHKLSQRMTVELALEKETKITRSVVENHRRSREYVRRVFGA